MNSTGQGTGPGPGPGPALSSVRPPIPAQHHPSSCVLPAYRSTLPLLLHAHKSVRPCLPRVSCVRYGTVRHGTSRVESSRIQSSRVGHNSIFHLSALTLLLMGLRDRQTFLLHQSLRSRVSSRTIALADVDHLQNIADGQFPRCRSLTSSRALLDSLYILYTHLRTLLTVPHVAVVASTLRYHPSGRLFRAYSCRPGLVQAFAVFSSCLASDLDLLRAPWSLSSQHNYLFGPHCEA